MSVAAGESATATPAQYVLYPLRNHAAAARSAVTLGDYLDAIYRRRWWIFGVVILAIAAAWTLSRQMPRVYEGIATLDVDRVAPGGLMGSDTGTQVAPDLDQVLATHVRMVQSDAVLRPVVEKYHLLRDAGSRGDAADRGNAPITLRALAVARPPNTYLIQITYRAGNPETAAAVANSIAASYIDHLRALHAQNWGKVSDTTRWQLSELKSKMEHSNEALLTFQRKIGMVDPEDKTNVLTARLLQLNTDFARAQSDRAAKDAAYQTLRTGGAEAAESSLQGEQLRRLLERKSEAQQKFSDTRAVYAENHPEYQRAQAQLRDVEAQVRAAYTQAIKRGESELKEAKLREANLNRTYLQTKAEADTLAARAVEYRLLRQRADADRTLYDELSRKVGEAEINSGLRGIPVRVADLARPDRRPASPNVPLNCAIAMLLSLLAGCVLSVVYDARHLRLRNLEDVRAASGVETVRALPRVARWRGRRGAGGLALGVQEGEADDLQLSRFREVIRMLRGELAERADAPGVKVIAVVSAGAGEGRSRIAAELANAYAALELRTLLIDANVRAQIPDRSLTSGANPGLVSALAGESRWQQAVVHPSRANTPDLLPAGAADPRSPDLLHQRLDWLVTEACDSYDVILLDSPPFLRFSESLDIVRSADVVIAVARSGVTNPRALETMAGYLRRMNSHIGAVLLNDAPRA